MARIIPEDDWSDPITLEEAENWQPRGGPVLYTTGEPEDQLDGIELAPNSVTLFEPPITLRVRRSSGSASFIVRAPVSSGPAVTFTLTPEASVAEDAGTGTPVATIGALDPVTAVPALGGTHAALLKISGDEVQVNAALTGIEALSFTVTATAQDHHPATRSAIVPVTAAPQPGVPAQFGAGDWSLTSGDTEASLTITALPSDGGSTITALEYRLDSGAWVPLSGVTPGTYTITGLTNETEYSVTLRAVNAVGNGPVSAAKTVTPEAPPVSIPVIIEAGFSAGQPYISEAAQISPATVTGADSTTYQWYHGNPADGGTPIAEASAAGYTPVEGDYGEDLWLRATYTNASGSVTDDVQAGIVAIRFRENFERFTVGDTQAEMRLDGWEISQLGQSFLTVVADMDAPAGLAAHFESWGGTVRWAWPTVGDSFPHWGDSEYVEWLTLYREDSSVTKRTTLRARQPSNALSAGVSARITIARVQLPDQNVAGEVGAHLATLTPGEVYWIRQRIVGKVCMAKAWKLGDPEPAVWVEANPDANPLPFASPTYGAYTNGGDHRVLYISWAGNAPAPYWEGYDAPAQLFGEMMEFNAPSAQSAVPAFGGLITFNLEDV